MNYKLYTIIILNFSIWLILNLISLFDYNNNQTLIGFYWVNGIYSFVALIGLLIILGDSVNRRY